MLKEKISPSPITLLACALAVFRGLTPAAHCENIDKTAAAKARTNKSAKPVSNDHLNLIRRGKELFLTNQCLDCHLVSGKGCNDGIALDGIAQRRTKQFLQEHLKDPKEHVARNARAFGGNPNLMTAPNLSKSEIDDIAAYLLSLPSKPQSKMSPSGL